VAEEISIETSLTTRESAQRPPESCGTYAARSNVAYMYIVHVQTCTTGNPIAQVSGLLATTAGPLTFGSRMLASPKKGCWPAGAERCNAVTQRDARGRFRFFSGCW
jgi:hypothetical protein